MVVNLELVGFLDLVPALKFYVCSPNRCFFAGFYNPALKR